MPQATPAKSENNASLMSFPAIGGKKITAAFDGGRLNSDGGVLLLAQAERAMGICRQLAGCIADPRDPSRVVHRLDDILRARVLAIACGYEDADDLDALRDDPGFRLALGKLPGAGVGLASRPTMSRWENMPTTRELVRMMAAMVGIYCASYPAPPKAVTLDIDDTCDIVHGHQQLSFWNCHYGERCFLPIHVYDTATGRPVAMLLRTGKTPSGTEAAGHIRRLMRQIRRHWPDTHITIRGDEHYGRPEVMTFCEAHGVDYVLGLPTNPALRADPRIVAVADAGVVKRAQEGLAVVRTYAHTRYGARTWPRQRRVALRIEASILGMDIRYVVTSLAEGSAEHIYDTLYCARGQAENLIKRHKTQLASDRTSCRSANANQMRLILHTAAYWLLRRISQEIPKAKALANAEFATLRLRLVKVAARVIETASRIRVAFASACPDAELCQAIAKALRAAPASLSRPRRWRPVPSSTLQAIDLLRRDRRDDHARPTNAGTPNSNRNRAADQRA